VKAFQWKFDLDAIAFGKYLYIDFPMEIDLYLEE